MPLQDRDLQKVYRIIYTHFGNYVIIGICCLRIILTLRGTWDLTVLLIFLEQETGEFIKQIAVIGTRLTTQKQGKQLIILPPHRECAESLTTREVFMVFIGAFSQ